MAGARRSRTNNHKKPRKPRLQPIVERPEQGISESQISNTECAHIPSSLVEALQLIANGAKLPALPKETPSEHFKVGLDSILLLLECICPSGTDRPASLQGSRETLIDVANEIAVANSNRIFAAAEDSIELERIAINLQIAESDTMAGGFPSLTTSNLPQASAGEQLATASPARGSAMMTNIFKSVRVPEFRFKWQFWAEKGQQSSTSKDKVASSEDFASRPKPLGDQIISIKEFYQHFNNIPTDALKLRDSIHLFHVGVKPLWEDPRNTKGGAYYFRISKDVAEQFWHEICLLAVGDVLQGAVETKRASK
jgi:hypothetical protein